jgi:hypothetical protein
VCESFQDLEPLLCRRRLGYGTGVMLCSSESWICVGFSRSKDANLDSFETRKSGTSFENLHEYACTSFTALLIAVNWLSDIFRRQYILFQSVRSLALKQCPEFGKGGSLKPLKMNVCHLEGKWVK